MPQSSSISSSVWQMNLAEKWSRTLVLKFLQQLEHGHLILTENGQIIGEFGHKDGPQAQINVLRPRMYLRFLLDGDIGAGDSYMKADWETPDLLSVIRVFVQNMDVLDALETRFGWLTWPWQKLLLLTRHNSRRKARENILAHYDLGNDLYTRFLDKRMQYSSAIYADDKMDLEAAQVHKLHRLCQLLELNAQDHLLEIGTGWGGLAIFAAEHYGCRVTTTTISDAQYEYACAQVRAHNLTERVTVLNQDYRDLQGSYDKLVSVEMIEAVGRRYMPEFFRQCNARLKPGGRFVLQAITIADQREQRYNRQVDFIQQYVFPGGYLPSVERMATMFRAHTDMVIRQLDDIGLHYARTLADWRSGFNHRLSELEVFGYDEQFQRFWNYYLAYCEGGFSERRCSVVQLIATRAV